MSNEKDKIKFSKRRQNNENVAKRQAEILRHHKTPGYQSNREKQPHRFVKHHSMDCGNPGCYVCGNPRKTHKDKLTIQEKRLYQDVDRPINGLIQEVEELLNDVHYNK